LPTKAGYTGPIHTADDLLCYVDMSLTRDATLWTLPTELRKMLTLLRAWLAHPSTLLVDEQTDTLDAEKAHKVLSLLLKLASLGTTMAIVARDALFIHAIADRVILMDKGSLIEQGSPERVFNAPQTERAKQFIASYHFSTREKNYLPTFADYI